MTDLVAWLTQILDEDEAIALEASRHDEEPLVDGGEHWLWACDEHDETIAPDPLTQDVLACPQDFWRVSLRSVEQYPYRSISGEGPTIVFSTEEVPPTVALHILRHDPAAVLADIAAKRAIIKRHSKCGTGLGYCDDGGHGWEGDPLGCGDMADLTSAYAHRPGCREEWKP